MTDLREIEEEYLFTFPHSDIDMLIRYEGKTRKIRVLSQVLRRTSRYFEKWSSWGDKSNVQKTEPLLVPDNKAMSMWHNRPKNFSLTAPDRDPSESIFATIDTSNKTTTAERPAQPEETTPNIQE
jgi:hypothetical protein